MEHDIYDSLRLTATTCEKIADVLNAIARKVTASKNGITFGPGGYYDTKKLDKWIWPWTDVTYGAKFDAHNQCCVPVVVYGFL